MNKEIYQEGWLIKSPPTKRIWRARWRRRWFTLKQGEIPGQFCLEYYTDRNCRKIKGTIDLDQCEQVDCGLRLEHRKQKFQYMFAIKTPNRIYYLAADTEIDMRDWVNCICQVCNLHDSTKQAAISQYINLFENEAPPLDSPPPLNSESQNNNISNETTTSLNNTSLPLPADRAARHSATAEVIRRTNQLSITNNSGAYQNNELPYVNTEYCNRETIVCDSKFQVNTKQKQHQNVKTLEYLNVGPMGAAEASTSARTIISASGIVKKIPENLVLSNTFIESSVEPSPALSTSSGPYIPISECFSGSPKFLIGDNPTTPLNNLDPKFYDTPRSHNNIGLNLTSDQSYSPKITNCSTVPSKPRSGRSSPSESESVFTDDDEVSLALSLKESPGERHPRPSDSSVENEAIVFTYEQRFSKLPEEGKGKDFENSEEGSSSDVFVSKERKRRNHLVLETTVEDEKVLRDLPQFSDTDNTSPAIGPKDASSCVEESYDIPRSHNAPYYTLGQLMKKGDHHLSVDNPIAASTPNLISENGRSSLPSGQSRTLPRHCYTNAAPTQIEANVFRYDFVEQDDLPPVNRKLKPKVNLDDSISSESPKSAIPADISNSRPASFVQSSPIKPPSIDRKLKPTLGKPPPQPKVDQNENRYSKTSIASENELKTRTLPVNYLTNMSSIYSNSIRNMQWALNTPTVGISPSSLPFKNEHKLQYFDLDVANPPPIRHGSISSSHSLAGFVSKVGEPQVKVPQKSTVVYNTVDFVKTDAFKRVREGRKKGNEGNSSK